MKRGDRVRLPNARTGTVCSDKPWVFSGEKMWIVALDSSKLWGVPEECLTPLEKHLDPRANTTRFEPPWPPEDPLILAYLGGLIDGEGSITRNTKYQTWKVKVAMMDKEVIDWLMTLGGSRSSHHRASRSRREHEWYVLGTTYIHDFLIAILPFMRVEAKRAKAITAIKEIEERQSDRLFDRRRRLLVQEINIPEEA